MASARGAGGTGIRAGWAKQGWAKRGRARFVARVSAVCLRALPTATLITAVVVISVMTTVATTALTTRRAWAFHSDGHVGITEEAIRVAGGFDAEAASEIVAANLMTDRDAAQFNTHGAHFDSEAFSAGAARLRDKRREVLKSLSQCERVAALAAIGTSLHAIQDFFAHSNFVELHEKDAKPAKIDLFELKDPPTSLPCYSPGYSEGLTTGYWPNDPEKMRKLHKCTHDELAKDSLEASTYWYPLARAAALRASIDFLLGTRQAIEEAFGAGRKANVLRYLGDHRAAQTPSAFCAPGGSAGGGGAPEAPADLPAFPQHAPGS